MTLEWAEIFGLTVSPLELIVRGSAMYLFLFLVFRVVVRRRIGAVGMADILVLVIVSDAIQNSMAGEYTTATDGFILVATLVGWTIFTDWLTFRFRLLQRLLEPPPLPLVRDGRLLRRNLRAELISDEELRGKLREKGISDYSEVGIAIMESDGSISVQKRRAPSASAE